MSTSTKHPSQIKQEYKHVPVTYSLSPSTDNQQTEGRTNMKLESNVAIVSPDRESATSPTSSTATPTPTSTEIESETENQDDNNNTATANTSSTITDTIVPKSKSKKDYADWPLSDIKEPHTNDVLYGRGGGTNHHPGNKRYRKLVEARKVDYVNSKRLDKPLVALEIIKHWRTQEPPGRFLKIDEDTGTWHDVGDKKAREKTSQALREKAPMLRKQQEEQRRETVVEVGSRGNDGYYQQKNTRFTVPEKSSNKVNKNLSRAMLAREHSLGQDFVATDEPFSLKEFSWTTPVLEATDDISRTSSWDHHPQQHLHHPSSPTVPSSTDPSVAYAVRGSGSSSIAARQHHHHISPHHHHNQHHPISVAYHGSGANQHAINPYSVNEAYIPPPTQDGVVPRVDPEWTNTAASASTPHHRISHSTRTPQTSDTMHTTTDWRGFNSEDLATRKMYDNTQQNQVDYRLSRSTEDPYRKNRQENYFHPAPGGSGGVSPGNPNDAYLQSDDYARIANIVGTGPGNSYVDNWRSGDDRRIKNSEGYYDVSSYRSPDRMPSDPYMRGNNNWTSPHGHPQPSPQAQARMEYYRVPNNSNDAYLSEGTTPERCSSRDQDVFDPIGCEKTKISPIIMDVISRPPNVKRDTSHKLQTVDIEPTTKRMNRQRSFGNNKPSFNSSGKPVSEQEMKNLKSSLEHSSLGGVVDTALIKPFSLKASDRMTTTEQFNCLIGDIEGSSSPLDEGSATEQSRISNFSSVKLTENVGKPKSINDNDRISTFGTIDSDFVNEIGFTNATSV
mmetsp:Transcript_14573/g.16951  ORF Transcript_14573/g.16951 Transcript_14573/m.16951 type:complete len:786 (-) Transcript_14573:134-2491(-)